MRQRAIDRGLRLSEFGLIPEAEAGDLKGMAAAHLSLPAVDESEIYRHLDLEWVAPELREDTGEISAASSETLPRLIVPNDVKGALHNHTTLSDGDATLEQMADAARNIGWNWLGIADHSPTLKVANGASAEDLLAQGRQIKQYNEAWASEGVDFRLFHGVESDILEGGKLDHPDDVLSELDYVVASVHAMSKWKNRDEVTQYRGIDSLYRPPCNQCSWTPHRKNSAREGRIRSRYVCGHRAYGRTQCRRTAKSCRTQCKSLSIGFRLASV